MTVIPDGRRTVTRLFYATNFPLTENPISEGGQWIGGLTPGVDWNNIQTNGALAYSAVDVPGTFNDNVAILTDPRWASAPNQHGRGVVHSVSQDPNKYQEVELRFRHVQTAHVQTGYEVFWKLAHDGSQYISIARMDGPFGSFTTPHTPPVGPGIVDGDTIDAYLRGTIVTAYTNNVLQATWDITTAFTGADFYVGGVFQGTTSSNGTVYTTGAPGLGMDEGGSGGSTLTNWGFSSFFAESL